MAVRLIKESPENNATMEKVNAVYDEMLKHVDELNDALRQKTGYDFKVKFKPVECTRGHYSVEIEPIDVLDKCGIFASILDECVLASFSCGVDVKLKDDDKAYSLWDAIEDAPEEVKSKVEDYCKSNEFISYEDVIDKGMTFDTMMDEILHNSKSYNRFDLDNEIRRLRLYHPNIEDVITIWGSLDLQYHHKDGGSNGMDVIHYSFASNKHKFEFR